MIIILVCEWVFFCSYKYVLLSEQDRGERPSNSQCSFGHGDQLGIDITSECHEAAPCDVAAQLHSVKTGSEVQADMDVNTCHMKSEDTDLFRQHFGSLSTTHKVSDLACNITM